MLYPRNWLQVFITYYLPIDLMVIIIWQVQLKYYQKIFTKSHGGVAALEQEKGFFHCITMKLLLTKYFSKCYMLSTTNIAYAQKSTTLTAKIFFSMFLYIFSMICFISIKHFILPSSLNKFNNFTLLWKNTITFFYREL